MKILPGSEKEWESFSESDPDADFYQTPAWGKILRECGLAGKPACYRLELESGKQAFLPGMLVPRLGGLVYGWYSMPMGCHGGPLGEKNLAPSEWNELLEFLSRGVRRTASVLNLPPGLIPPESVRTERAVLIKDHARVVRMEDRSFSDLFNRRFQSRCRKNIRKALKEGLRVEHLSDLAEERRFIEMYHKATERWESRIPDRLITCLAKISLSQPDVTRFTLVKKGDAIVAGGAFLHHGTHVTPFISVMDRTSNATGSMSLFLSEGIQYACERGCKDFNLGSSMGIESVDKFKESFGAEAVPRYRIILRSPLWRKLRGS